MVWQNLTVWSERKRIYRECGAGKEGQSRWPPPQTHTTTCNVTTCDNTLSSTLLPIWTWKSPTTAWDKHHTVSLESTVAPMNTVRITLPPSGKCLQLHHATHVWVNVNSHPFNQSPSVTLCGPYRSYGQEALTLCLFHLIHAICQHYQT